MAGPRRASRRRGAGAGIRFGTSGWRGGLGEEVTFERVRALARGYASWLGASERGGQVLVGYDGRFASEALALDAAAILDSRGLVPVVSRGEVPTPAVTSALRRGSALGGLVFTASHNPPLDHGVKIFGAAGAAADPSELATLERLLGTASGGAVRGVAKPRRRDFAAAYRRRLLRGIDPDAFRTARLRVVYDAMHGSGAGCIDAVLQAAGARVERLRVEPDPHFGGGAPEPLPERLAALRARMRATRGLRVGLATDGDADRLAAVDEDGRTLTDSEMLALIVDHLAHTGRLRRGLALTLATGGLAARVARAHGVPVTRHPVGFKHLATALASGAADVAGDESGGVALGVHSFDKDGGLAGCLLALYVAHRRQPLRACLRDLERRHGRVSCARVAVPARPRLLEAVARLRRSPPRRVGGDAVRQAQRQDGLRVDLDDGFVMWRASGTEPLVRIYAEAPGPALLRRRLEAARALLERRAGAR